MFPVASYPCALFLLRHSWLFKHSWAVNPVLILLHCMPIALVFFYSHNQKMIAKHTLSENSKMCWPFWHCHARQPRRNKGKKATWYWSDVQCFQLWTLWLWPILEFWGLNSYYRQKQGGTKSCLIFVFLGSISLIWKPLHRKFGYKKKCFLGPLDPLHCNRN